MKTSKKTHFITSVSLFLLSFVLMGAIVLFAIKLAPKKVADTVSERIDCPIFARCPRGYKNKYRK